MRVLVLGATGFVGKHLVEELLNSGHEVIRAGFNPSGQLLDQGVLPFDLRDYQSIVKLLRDSRPDAIAHLAGLAHVVESGKTPVLLSEVSVVGMQYVCRAVVETLSPTRPLPFLFVSSAMVFGAASTTQGIDESFPVRPDSPYSFSKVATEFLLQTYRDTVIKPYVVRPFNHTGPGQDLSFVCPALASRLYKAQAGGSIEIGNVSSQRDFTDVRDVVRAYRLIMEKQPVDNLFVLGSGKLHSIEEVVQELQEISGKHVRYQVNKDLLRQETPAAFYAVSGRAEKLLGWKPQIPLKQTLSDLYKDVAARLG